MGDFQVEGADAIRDLSTALKRVPEGKQIKNEVAAEFRTLGKPLTAAVQENLKTRLPQRGGIAKKIAEGTKAKIRNRFTGESAGISLQVTSQTGEQVHDLASIEAGRLRHPTFGHEPWKTTKVTPDLIAETVTEQEDLIRSTVLQALDTALAKIEESL